jgi:hypothetical protein
MQFRAKDSYSLALSKLEKVSRLLLAGRPSLKRPERTGQRGRDRAVGASATGYCPAVAEETGSVAGAVVLHPPSTCRSVDPPGTANRYLQPTGYQTLPLCSTLGIREWRGLRGSHSRWGSSGRAVALLTLEFYGRYQVPWKASTGSDVEPRGIGTQQGIIDTLRTQELMGNMGNFRSTERVHCLCCSVYGGLALPAMHTRDGQVLGSHVLG